MRAAAPLRLYGPWRTEWVSNRTRGAFCALPSAFASSYTSGRNVGITATQASGNVSSPFGACLSAMSLPDPASTPPDVTTNTHWTVANQGLILHDLDHRQARDTRYKHCGWKVAYDCKAGAVLEPGVPFWGGSDPGSCSDTMCSCVWVDLPDKHGLLFFGQLATTPEGYTAPGDPDGLIHQGYGNAFHYTSTSGLPNVCCHNQDDPYGGRPVRSRTIVSRAAGFTTPTTWSRPRRRRRTCGAGRQRAIFSSRNTSRSSRIAIRRACSVLRTSMRRHAGSTSRWADHDTVTVAPNDRPTLMVFEVA